MIAKLLGLLKNKKENTEELSFLEHLDALRYTLFRSSIVIIILTVVAFIFKDFIFNSIILAPKEADFFTNRVLCKFGNKIGIDLLCINIKALRIVNTELAGQFRSHIWISFVVGILVAVPYILFEIWKFIKPALYDNESGAVKGFVLTTSFLFAIGVLFGYYIIVPLAVNFLASYEISANVENYIRLSSYIGTLTGICLATGMIFELPLLIYLLTKIGIVTPQFLKNYRKHSIVAVFIISAIITPPDVFSQILVAIPLMALYEIGIIISTRVYKKKQLGI